MDDAIISAMATLRSMATGPGFPNPAGAWNGYVAHPHYNYVGGTVYGVPCTGNVLAKLVFVADVDCDDAPLVDVLSRGPTAAAPTGSPRVWAWEASPGAGAALGALGLPATYFSATCSGTIVLQYVLLDAAARTDLFPDLTHRVVHLGVNEHEVEEGYVVAPQRIDMTGGPGAKVLHYPCVPVEGETYGWVAWKPQDGQCTLKIGGLERLVTTPQLTEAVIAGALGTYDHNAGVCLLPMGPFAADAWEMH